MKIGIVVLIGLLATGCTRMIDGWELRSIDEQCESVARVNTLLSVYGVCSDGKVVNPERGQ